MAQKIIAILIALAYPLSEGMCHAILFSEKGSDAYKWNEHYVFDVQRLLFLAAMLLHAQYNIFMIGGWFLCFPFLHNGMYYTQRNIIDRSYQKRWWDMTTTSSARLNFSVKLRSTLFILGILVIVAGFISW